MKVNLIPSMDDYPYSLYGHEYQCGLSFDFALQSKIRNHHFEISDRVLTPDQIQYVYQSSYIFKYRGYDMVIGYENDPEEINLYLSKDIYIFSSSGDPENETFFCVFDPAYLCFKTEDELVRFKLKYQRSE